MAKIVLLVWCACSNTFPKQTKKKKRRAAVRKQVVDDVRMPGHIKSQCSDGDLLGISIHSVLAEPLSLCLFVSYHDRLESYKINRKFPQTAGLVKILHLYGTLRVQSNTVRAFACRMNMSIDKYQNFGIKDQDRA